VRAVVRFWVVSLTLLVFAGWQGIVAAERIMGAVVGVADGDTLTVVDEQHRQHKVRLSGIDAPEKRQDLAIDPSRASAN
jgi:endonuclease YncB( thermonuclease family)